MSKILIVDDDADLAEMIRLKVTSEGHEAAAVHSGEEAFEMAKQHKPDVAILDVMLPGVTGYQVCRRIRRDPELYKMGILILTALGEEPEIQHGLEQGADDYLAKPFKTDHLMDKVNGLCGMLDSIKQRNAVTGFPGTEAIKREINHRLARGMAIAACYLDIAGFKPYCAAKGKEGQERALAFMAGLLRQLPRTLGIYEWSIAHLGGEHFVALLNLEDYERFCSAVCQEFDQRKAELYTEKELEEGCVTAKDKSGREAKYRLMALAIGVAHTQFRRFKSAKKMFEVLAQTRQKAQPDNRSTVFVDRRRTDR